MCFEKYGIANDSAATIRNVTKGCFRLGEERGGKTSYEGCESRTDHGPIEVGNVLPDSH